MSRRREVAEGIYEATMYEADKGSSDADIIAAIEAALPPLVDVEGVTETIERRIDMCKPMDKATEIGLQIALKIIRNHTEASDEAE
jgi:hypothetical protein